MRSQGLPRTVIHLDLKIADPPDMQVNGPIRRRLQFRLSQAHSRTGAFIVKLWQHKHTGKIDKAVDVSNLFPASDVSISPPPW
tara:strand:- start:244 stop:492 length:249 start_codon:yes stop_codon:yes gene_type:complete